MAFLFLLPYNIIISYFLRLVKICILSIYHKELDQQIDSQNNLFRFLNLSFNQLLRRGRVENSNLSEAGVGPT